MTHIIKKHRREIWQKRWNLNPDHAAHTKLWIPQLDKKKSDKMMRMPKKTLSKAIQLITNFNNGNYHTQNKKLNNGEITRMACRLCKRGRETGWHLLTDCEHLRHEA